MEDYLIDAKEYLPEFLQNSSLMSSIVDCLNVLVNYHIYSVNVVAIYKTKKFSYLGFTSIAGETGEEVEDKDEVFADIALTQELELQETYTDPATGKVITLEYKYTYSNLFDPFRNINEAYIDMLYKTRNYFKLSTDAKIAVIKELGFDYLLDIVPMTDEQLSQLLIFFNFVYLLKGRQEGLEICLRALGITEFTYTSWENQEPLGTPYTATLTILLDSYNNDSVLTKLKNFVRCYMLPWIDIILMVTVEGATFYMYPSCGIMMKENCIIPNEVERDINEGEAEIHTGPGQQYVPLRALIPITFSLPINSNITFEYNDTSETYDQTSEPAPSSTDVISLTSINIYENNYEATFNLEFGTMFTYKVNKTGYDEYQNHIVPTEVHSIIIDFD